MIVTSLKLANFRNYQMQTVRFSPGVNLIYGANASGKTNILEALHFISKLASFKSERDTDLIRKGEKGFEIVGNFSYDSGASLTAELFFHSGQKFLRANEMPVLKVSDWYGRVPLHLFSPESMKVLWGEPARRRELWDAEIARLDPQFRQALATYKTAWKSRNKVLKRISAGERDCKLNSLLSFYTDSLVASGSRVVFSRLKLLKDVMEILPNIYGELTREKLFLRASYKTAVKGLTRDSDFSAVRTGFLEALEKFSGGEKECGFTLIGPHRDDLRFYLNDVPLGQVASQGQVRATTIALIVSLAYISRKASGEAPIILMDDALSELDDERKVNLIRLLAEYPQSLVTSASKREIAGLLFLNPTLMKVEGGQVFPVETAKR